MGLRVITCCAILLSPAIVSAAEPPAPSAPDAYPKYVVPIVKQYCAACHGEKKQIAGINLTRAADEAAVTADRKTWEKVREQLESRVMPPDGRPQPTEQERAFLIAYLDARLASLDCVKGPRNPGQVTMRRLNRNEYNNTIRDLLALDFQPAADFPSDDVGYGFDNIGDVLSMPPLLMEKYLAAAEKILDKAFTLDLRNKQVLKRWRATELPGQAVPIWQKGRRIMYTPGTIWQEYAIPWPGDYFVRITVHGQPAKGENPKLSLQVDGKELKVVEITSSDEKKPQTFEVRFTTEKPKVRWVGIFLNPTRPAKDFKNDQYDAQPDDRTITVHTAEVDGPLDQKPLPRPESYRRIMVVEPKAGAERSAAEAIIRNFARKAYRRPASSDEVAGLLKLYDLAAGEPFEQAIRLPLTAILVSPHFLFRIESDPPQAKPGEPYPLSDLELASRLSYFLWASMPDEELLSVAERGELGKPAMLEKQVRRMLADPKVIALTENFAGQWLQLRTLRTLTPDRKSFRAYSPELRASMVRETELFVEEIVRKDRSVLDFLAADFTYVDSRLVKHYGLKGVNISGDAFERVALPKDGPRGGVLTQASVLTVTSNPTRTSPVKRGKWVLENLLGAPPPPPPPDVPELEDEKGELTGSLRQRMEQHRAKAMCASCHARMDPLGFGLENFDGIGGWRDKDGSFAIDASGTLPNGQSFDGPAGLKKVLLDRGDDFRRCLAEKLLTYALGRGLEYYDRCALESIVQNLKARDDRFSALVLEIVTSDPFRRRRAGQE